MKLPPLPKLKVPLEPVRRESHMRALLIADRKAVIEACAECVPDTWLDPLLTGAGAVVGGDVNCRHIEAVLRGVKERIRALLGEVDQA